MDVTLHLGDCLEYMRGMDTASVDAVVTDPPYNIGFRGYGSYADNLPDHEYIELLCEFQQMPVAIIQYPEEMMRWVVPALGPPDYVASWCYNANIPRRFRLVNFYGLEPQYERIRKPYKNPTDRRVAELIAGGSAGTSLYEWWDDIQLVKNVSLEKEHPCPVPVALMERIITLTTEVGDTVFDPFMGSGTTGVACVKLGRNFIGCEINPDYYKIAERRIAEARMQLPLDMGIAA